MNMTPLENWIFRKINSSGKNLTREDIETYQLEKLRETIGWARRKSNFYRALLSDYEEEKFCRLEDLSRLPFTTAEDIRRDPLQFLCISQSEISRVVTLPTSGTTGDPKRLYFTEDDQERTIDFFCCGMSTFVGPGDRVLILLPGNRPGSIGDLLVRALRRQEATGVLHGPVKDVRNTLDVMTRTKMDALVGIPSQVLALARHWPAAADAPQNVLLSTDYIPEAVVRELRHSWGCQVFTHYGMTEMGYGGGVECHAHFGYHLREADLFLEVIDPATGTPVENGKSGEVAFTTLTRVGMPLIRYRTGDISRFIPENCPCGTILKSLEKVKGRIGGSVKLGGTGILSITELDETLFALPGLLDFSAHITRESDKDRLHIEIVTMEANGKHLAKRARSAVGAIDAVQIACEEEGLFVSIDVRQEVQTVPSVVGKRRIIDLR